MSANRKRKREPVVVNEESSRNGRNLSLQAFEAVIIPNARERRVKLASGKQEEGGHTGLIEWSISGTEGPILVDRYDARLLLGSLPETSQSKSSTKFDLDDGWEDLPSDSDDLFFFNREEAEDIRREKKRRLIESNREARLLAIKASDPEEQLIHPWGGSDEEPDESVMALMKKTAIYIVSSPNPVQLEMRILANHGGDARFSFLRGRWRRAWQAVKDSSRGQPVTMSSKPPTTSGLVSYDSEGEDNGADKQKIVSTEGLEPQAIEDDARIKAERRARVKEWSRKRKENGGI